MDTPTTQVQENKFIRDSISRGNIKVASIAKNIIAQYGIDFENISTAALAAFARNSKLADKLKDYREYHKQILEWYPSGTILSVIQPDKAELKSSLFL